MKKSTLFLILLSLATLGSCKKKNIFFGINLNSEVVVSSTFSQLVPFSVTTPEITSNSEAEFEINNTKKDYVKSIYLDNLKLIITSPSSQTFSFLNSVEIFISANGLEEKKVAFKQNIPNTTGTQLRLDLVKVDLQEYIKKDKFSIRSVFVTDETITHDVTISIEQDYLVSAKLSKK